MAGLLRVENQNIVDENGDVVVLKGWGIGNWLLQEGYMWLNKSIRFDRPHRIEKVVEELTGKTYAESFWKKFRETYVSEDDIKLMKEIGYNSVRLPFNWLVLMEDEPGFVFKEEGFRLIDNFFEWCEKYDLYVILDMHGAPGGQTGANIDDCVDDIPRLFIDQDKWDKAIALWVELAKRYKDSPVLAGYDLLNEPIRPKNEFGDYDYLVDKLIQFYEKTIEAIRKVDKKHLISIEGHHWAIRTEIFDRVYDEQMVIHFHRYWCEPELEVYEKFLEVSERLNKPLWLGETGENNPQWFSAMFELSTSLGIGYNLWPYKKMDTNNSVLSIKEPKDWNLIVDYANGLQHPGYEVAQRIFDEYLENIKFENCEHVESISNHALRENTFELRAADFDEVGYSYNEKHVSEFRKHTGMLIEGNWAESVLTLVEGEYVSYTVNKTSSRLEIDCSGNGVFEVYQDDVLVKDYLTPGVKSIIRIKQISGDNRYRLLKFK